MCGWTLKVVLFTMLYWQLEAGTGALTSNVERNLSDVAIALSEIINGLKPRHLAILAKSPRQSQTQSRTPCRRLHRHQRAQTDADTDAVGGQPHDEGDDIRRHVDDFIFRIHQLYYKSVIFYDIELFFRYIESNLQGSIESVNLIFYKPYELSACIQERKLSHRLSLFIFYWGAKYPPKANEVRFEEPIRAVVITRPRKKAFRIYYNQAVPTGESNLKLVNWYDGDNLGLQKVPLLPSAAVVYSNFHSRIFRVPVFHSPPWFWVSYNNETNESSYNLSTLMDYNDVGSYNDIEYNEVNVTGGRDHRLLSLLAEHMNFQFVYIEAPGRTQGSLRADSIANESFTGGIGLLQNGFADFFLGDVGLSWERRKAIEFSFFTLADSGAFATHAPRRLNEALAIMRPFKMDIWPYLILTVLFSGPIFYAIIAIPYKWRQREHTDSQQLDIEKLGELGIHMVYIKEITRMSKRTRHMIWAQNRIRQQEVDRNEMPKNLFDRCIWFTVQLFLKQSCHELYHGYRAKFLMIVYWIAATYVLADVYSAQLTSQFARPAHEPPINTLQRLQSVMLKDGYKLYVEKESSSLEMLENGTEIFRQLYALMKQQRSDEEEGFLIDSVEAGIMLIADGLENKAVLGGRETLYFNIQQYGSKNFQLSQKLYTRYSAVGVQIGCPFLDSLNEVLIHLFEGGILDKMTTAEYEAQSRMINKELNEQNQRQNPKKQTKPGSALNVADADDVSVSGVASSAASPESSNNDAIGKSAESGEKSAKQQAAHDSGMTQALNLRMLQGAFFALLFGYGTASVILLLEFCSLRLNFACCRQLRQRWRTLWRRSWQRIRYLTVRILR